MPTYTEGSTATSRNRGRLVCGFTATRAMCVIDEILSSLEEAAKADEEYQEKVVERIRSDEIPVVRLLLKMVPFTCPDVRIDSIKDAMDCLLTADDYLRMKNFRAASWNLGAVKRFLCASFVKRG